VVAGSAAVRFVAMVETIEDDPRAAVLTALYCPS